MSTLTALALAYLTAFVANLIPAFMPPTFSVLAMFLIHGHLPLYPLTIGGALAAGLGRLGLALLTRNYGRRLLAPHHRANLRRLGEWLEAKPRWIMTLAVALFSLGPIPTNDIFIAAGLTAIPLAPVVFGFVIGSSISFTVYDLLAKSAVGNLKDLFLGQWTNLGALLVEVLLVVLVIVLAKINWARFLHLPPAQTHQSSHAHDPDHRHPERPEA